MAVDLRYMYFPTFKFFLVNWDTKTKSSNIIILLLGLGIGAI